MGEVVQSCVSQRDWRLECYDAHGVVAQCVIDTDHGALRIGLTSALEKFFELRAEQVGRFRVAFDKAIMANRFNTGRESSHQQLLHCYSNDGKPRLYSIQPECGALHITCVDLFTGTQGFFLRLQAEQIGAFRVALNAALEVVRTDRAMYGTRWADDEEEDNLRGLSPLGNETQFASQINTMVTDEAPHLFALVEEVKDRVDAAIIAWGMAFSDHVEVISAGHSGIRGIFSTAQRAQRLLSTRHNLIRLVWVTEVREHCLARMSLAELIKQVGCGWRRIIRRPVIKLRLTRWRLFANRKDRL